MATVDHPNILFIMSDDIGWFNVSCYNHGIMGYRTPNIDRIAAEGAMFTDFYGQQSCTAGRAAFITGQQPIRTGLTKVGFPGAMQGLSAEDPTIAQFLKNFGYATGQFGKNHVGDRNEHLPTVHGFDEFFGNLYHLNAEEEPGGHRLSEGPEFRKRFGPRGVMKCKATDKDDATVDRAVRQGGQAGHREHRPADTEAHGDRRRGIPVLGHRFHRTQDQRRNPWFCYFNTHAHACLHPPQAGVQGQDRPRRLSRRHGRTRRLRRATLDKLDELGVTESTIVVFTTDNGAEVLSWPDGGATPFRGEKDTNWEGGWRIPCVMRWPGVIEPGQVINDICSLQDFIPTSRLLRASLIWSKR